jgi:phage shock protein A
MSRDPERAIEKLQMRLADVEQEGKQLRRKIARLRRHQKQLAAAETASGIAQTAATVPDSASDADEPSLASTSAKCRSRDVVESPPGLVK